MDELFSLQGKTAVVTGGGGVLCSEMARALAQRGASVAVLDLREDKAAAVVDEIKQAGGSAVGIKCDVLDKDSITAACNQVMSEFRQVDILINGAGGNRPEATTSDEMSFFEIPIEALKTVFDLNLVGAVLTCQVFGREMAEKGQGSIINISSMAAFRPLTKIVGYAAAKAALNNFTQWLAVHLNQNYSPKIRVNAIAPGFLLTEQNRYLLVDAETGEDTERGRLIKQHTPMGRYGRPEELTGTVIWLASDASSFVNGTVVCVDGGFAAFSGV